MGLSDHTAGHSTVLGAITLGARMIEKHFTDDTSRKGPDHPFSMDPTSWRKMVDDTRLLESSMGSSVKKVEDNEKETVILQRRAIRLVVTKQEGEVINLEDIQLIKSNGCRLIIGRVERLYVPDSAIHKNGNTQLELLNSIDEFCIKRPEAHLSDFLEEVSLLSDIDHWNDSDNV